MRRRIFINLVLIGVAVMAVHMLTSGTQNEGIAQQPNGTQVRFIEFNPLSRQAPASVGELQNAIDRVSEAAMNGQWVSASQEVNRLEELWDRMRPSSREQLEIEQGISRGIENLHYNVWGRDAQGVLITGQKLTDFLNRLSQ